MHRGAVPIAAILAAFAPAARAQVPPGPSRIVCIYDDTVQGAFVRPDIDPPTFEPPRGRILPPPADLEREIARVEARVAALPDTAAGQAPLLRRLGDLWRARARAIEAEAYDDARFRAEMAAFDAGDKATQGRLEAERAALLKRADAALDRAIDAFGRRVRGWPDLPDASVVRFDLASAVSDRGNAATAGVAFERLAAEHPGSPFAPWAGFRAAEAAFDRGDFVRAARLYATVEALPGSVLAPWAAYRHAWCAFNLGDFPGAVRRLQRLLATTEAARDRRFGPLDRAVRTDLVRAWSRLGTPEEAPRFVATIFPKDPERALLGLARTWEEDGRIDRAAALLRAIAAGAGPAPSAPHVEAQRRAMELAGRLGARPRTLEDAHALAALAGRARAGGGADVAEAVAEAERALGRLLVGWMRDDDRMLRAAGWQTWMNLRSGRLAERGLRLEALEATATLADLVAGAVSDAPQRGAVLAEAAGMDERLGAWERAAEHREAAAGLAQDPAAARSLRTRAVLDWASAWEATAGRIGGKEPPSAEAAAEAARKVLSGSERFLQAAQADDPSLALAWRLAGRTRQALGRPAEAAEAYRKAMRLARPDDREGAFAAGALLDTLEAMGDTAAQREAAAGIAGREDLMRWLGLAARVKRILRR